MRQELELNVERLDELQRFARSQEIELVGIMKIHRKQQL